MDEDLYDEFGNYIGPGLDDDADVGSGSDLGDRASETDEVRVNGVEHVPTVTSSDVIVYDEEEEEESVYKDVEVFVHEEDTQTLETPIVKSEETKVERVSTIRRLDSDITAKNFHILEESLPTNRFSFQFMTTLMNQPEFIRNICICGDLHHGKTTFVDRLIEHSRFMDPDASVLKNPPFTRYTDSRLDEQARELSIKATPISLIFQNDLYANTKTNGSIAKHKSFLFNIFDTPGHVNFIDEFLHAQSLCDGCVLVVDVLMGCTSVVTNLLKQCIYDGTHICVVLNCLDRLILELKLPPLDALHKIKHTLGELNECISQTSKLLGKEPRLLSPLLNNVAFASGQFGIFFTLKSFAKLYGKSDIDSFSANLWGKVALNPETGKFARGGDVDVEWTPSFVQFILEPLYKIFSHVASDERPQLTPVLSEIGVALKASDYKLSTKRILKKVFKQMFNDPSPFVDFILSNIPAPTDNGLQKLKTLYTGDQTSDVAKAIEMCDPNAQLMVFVAKNYYRLGANTFDLFARVMSGTLHKGQKIKILGDLYSLDDDEDALVRTVDSLWISEARYRVQVNSVSAGNWVLISGTDLCSHKISTITTIDSGLAEIFKISTILTIARPVFKVACEPLNPSELPKMVQGLSRIDKSYPAAKTKVEESGEHIIQGTGELYLDCVLHDLRRLYGDLEIKVSDPVVTFTETIMEQSSMKCSATTPNGKNQMFMIAEPLEEGIASNIDEGLINPHWPQKQLANLLTSKYNWDVLAARSIWTFGPDENGPNVLIDDVLDPLRKQQLSQAKSSIIQGFSWACKEGPLIEEPIRSVKFKLMDGTVAQDPISASAGQIIPTVRRLTYGSFLLATPRLMEPIVFSEIFCPADLVSSLYNILTRRRGHVLKDVPKPGTPFYVVHAYLPAIESFGFETDLRVHTSGQAYCTSMFDHWNIVPGDPLDKNIVLRPLEPAPVPHLAREFLLKTRRRKGLTQDISINKYFDEGMLSLLSSDLENFY